MLSKHIRFKKFILLSLASSLALMIVSVSGAQAANQLIAQGYPANSSLQPGMIVQLKSSSPNQVVAVTSQDTSKMLGVVISANAAALTLSQPTNSNEVYVSNSGQHNVLVTSQNGPIVVGDYITVSSVAGLGMKADSSESEVLGQAAGSFDGVHNVLSTTQLTQPDGKKSNVAIGSIPVDINIASNPLNENAKGVPKFLSTIAKYATNKSVSATRVYLAMLCVIAGLIVAITIVYAAIKNGFISIGRNPLAKKAITLNLLRVAAISVIIFGLSLGAAYLIVTR